MYRRLFVILLAFSLSCLFSCGEKDEIDNTKPPQEQPDMPDDGNEDSEESNPEDLPDFCDVQSIEGWTNVRFCKNGMVIFTKNYDGTQQVNKVLMFVPTEECGITSIYGEYDESGFPKYLSFDDAVVFVEDYKDGLVDLTVIQGEESMWAAEDLDLSQPVAVSTRAWGDNNWVRNTCAVGGVITSSIGIGAGVVVTGATGGVGSVLGGGAMIAMSSRALVDNLDTLFGTGGDFVFSEYAIGKMEGICMETMVDMLLENEESYLQTLWPDKFNFNKGAPNVPSTFWLDLAMEVVDAKWGKTVTEADKRRAFIIAHLGYKIETGRADEIKRNSATLYGYISPKAMTPLDMPAEIEYGFVLYLAEDENDRRNIFCDNPEGGLFDWTVTQLELDTEYKYFTYYYDKTNYATRLGDVKSFRTKSEDDMLELRELLEQFHYDTDGDNWKNNDNWCTDAPLDEWYGVGFDEYGYCTLNLRNNNLTGFGILSDSPEFVRLYLEENQLSGLDVSSCISLKQLDCSNNQLTSLDVSSCTSLERLLCHINKLMSLNVSGCTSLVDLSCFNNQLTSLDVLGCTSLEWLSCSGNRLTRLNVSGFTSLSSLVCGCNKLTSLNVTGCSKLSTLDCCHNVFTSLDLSGCVSLTWLHCDIPRKELNISSSVETPYWPHECYCR